MLLIPIELLIGLDSVLQIFEQLVEQQDTLCPD